jgi:uncharacterized membrane protein
MFSCHDRQTRRSSGSKGAVSTNIGRSDNMKIRLQDVVRTGILAALAVALQATTLPQPVTGPGINAVLFVASLYVGPLAGACVGIITPWVALLMGINKLAAAVPVIMLGNVTLALVAGYAAKFNKYVAMALAAVLKFAVMTLGIKYLMSTGTNIPAAAYTSLTITQLFTAMGGAVVAAIVLAALSRATKQ